MANRFADSIKEGSTQASKQGSLSDMSPPPPQMPADVPAIASIAHPNTVPSEKPSISVGKKKSESVTLNIGDVIDSLDVKSKKGESVTLYLKKDVLEQLQKMADEKNLKPSKIASAILEKAILQK